MKMRSLFLTVGAAFAVSACVQTPKTESVQAPKVESVKLFSLLPEYCNTPDGMAFWEEKGLMILAVPNFNDTRYPGIIMTLDEQGAYSLFYPAPVHPETGKGAPMGIEFGPDGNLYYADNQYFFDKNNKSRVMRINMKNGIPVSCDPVIENLKLANAVRWSGNYLYVSDTFLDLDETGETGWGAIYRVSLDEMKQGVVKLHTDKNAEDRHLVAKEKAIPNHRNDNAGFDGMCFDGEGNLYTGNFGDGVFYKITFDKNQQVVSCKVISTDLTCVDGICYDPKRNVIYIADSERNAIHFWDIKSETMHLLWENDDTDGADGLLDQPCEPLVWNDKIIVANFDMPFPGLKNSKYDGVHTLSVIYLVK